jgi:hypothetical protein
MLVNTQALQSGLSTNDLSIIMKEKSLINKEELIRSGMALTILIQSFSL